MKLIKDLVVIDKKSTTAVYLQINNTLLLAIKQGKLRKGVKLPGSREAAVLVGVNRMTMVAAYDELEAQGWIEKIPRKGTFVRKTLPEIKPEKIKGESYNLNKSVPIPFTYSKKIIRTSPSSDFPDYEKLHFNDGFPDPRITPMNELLRAMRNLFRKSSGKKYLMYGGTQGTEFLREQLAIHLNDTRGLSITKKNILITRGAQMGLYIAGSLLLDSGDVVVVGQPGYAGANHTFCQLGGRLVFVNVDKDGIITDELENICKKRRVKMVYVIPHHHHPTTVTLTPERRLHLLSLAAKYSFAVLEDDYDYDFHYSSKPIMPMASIDTNGSVIYVGTMTKTLAPSIRFGFMVGSPSLIEKATAIRKSIDTQGDSMMENALGVLFKDGTISRHIRKSVKLYRERRDHLCTLLAEELGNNVSFKVPDGGMSVWVEFLNTDLKQVALLAKEKGLIIGEATEYDTRTKKFNAVRLGFASLNLREQEKAVAILKAVINSL